MERLLAQTREDSSGCWLWTGTADGRGYGQLSVRGRHRKAHRVSFELEHGPIPNELFVLHRCDKPSCVNPDHLFLGTAADNTADMVSKGRHTFGERAVHAKLKERDVRAIKASAEMNKALAAKYGVNSSLISMIRTGKRWAHVL
jgi:HNH endonuclease